MAGFRKAKGRQAFLKMAIYGPQGSGKTFTSLLVGEGLANAMKRRMAVVDTETGTHFYSETVGAREVHPEAFDFDVLETRSVVDVTRELKKLNPKEHGVIVIDSITHVWEAAQAAYSGRRQADGGLPFGAWDRIKRPYKALLTWLLGCPMHVIICGRMGKEYETKDGQMEVVGYKMLAEKETLYEPHMVVRLDRKGAAAVEKDRTGMLTDAEFIRPGFDQLAKPLLPLLGLEQSSPPSSDDAGARDAEANAEVESENKRKGKALVESFLARFSLATAGDDLDAVSKELTTGLKKIIGTEGVATLRKAYLDRREQLK